MNHKIKIKKGDEVIVLAGKDKGKKGKPDNNQPGGIIEKEMPIHISNLSYFDSSSNKGVRVGYKFANDKKIRFNKLSGKEI